MPYKDKFVEIRLVTAIEGHKKGKGLVPRQTEFRIPPPPPKKKNILLQDLGTHTIQFRQSDEGDNAYFRNVNGKGIPFHAKQAQKGGRVKPLHILDPGARMRCVVSVLPRPL